MSRSSSAEAQTKLQDALQRLENYDDDTDVALLGTVLIGLHGALENHIREVLVRHAPLSREEKHEVMGDRGVKRAGWLPLVKWMEKYFGLSKADRRLMLDANDLRNEFAHSGSLSSEKLLVKDLRHYAEFVQDCFDRTWVLEDEDQFESVQAPSPETPTSPKTKLQDALQRLETCDNETDPAILGTVLIGLHGALENHLRELLFRCAPLSEEKKCAVMGDRRVTRTGWLSLVNWMEQYFGLSRNDRRRMLDANDWRNEFAHSGTLSAGKLLINDLRDYAEFVQTCFDRTWVLEDDYQSQSVAAPASEPALERAYLPAPPPPRQHPHETFQPREHQPRESYNSHAPASVKRPTASARLSKPIGGGADWIVRNVKGVVLAFVIAAVAQGVIWIAIGIVEACNLLPGGTASVIAPAAGALLGLASYFEMQARGLGLTGSEWSIFSVMGLAAVYIPATLMGWIGKSLFPTGNSFLVLIYCGGFGALLGLVLGIAQYQVLYPRRLNAQGWIPASVLDWSLCVGFVPLLKFLRPEVEASSVATVVLPIAGFLLGKAVTGAQIRRLRPF